MYLVAIKSVYRRIGEGSIVVIDDGTLRDKDRETIAEHLGDPAILRLKDIDAAPCPQGGTWERLLTAVDLSKDAYVIQVDSDILAVEELPEVTTAYRENRAFTLSSGPAVRMETLRASAMLVADWNSAHVQVVAERAFDRLPRSDSRRYVRGCSGFAGYARGGIDRRSIEEFSEEVERLLGARWNEWGSEQVTSNYAVANSADAIVLPHPKYASFYLDVDCTSSALLHFLGTNRFRRYTYERMSREVIREMLRTQRQGSRGEDTSEDDDPHKGSLSAA